MAVKAKSMIADAGKRVFSTGRYCSLILGLSLANTACGYATMNPEAQIGVLYPKIELITELELPRATHSDGDQVVIIAAQTVLIDIVRKLRRRDEALIEMLSPDFAERFASVDEIVEWAFGSNEALASFQPFEYQVSADKQQVVIRFWITVLNEGTSCTLQSFATLVRTESNWELSQLGRR